MTGKTRIRLKAPSAAGISVGMLGGEGTSIGRRMAAVTQKSMQDVIANYELLLSELRGVTPEVIEEALEPTFKKSQELVPVDSGALKQSGRLFTESFGTRVTGRITYGNPSVDYAALVHELLGKYHKPPTQAKYLQAPMMQDLPKFKARLIAAYLSRMP